jgi:hypothetical protein
MAPFFLTLRILNLVEIPWAKCGASEGIGDAAQIERVLESLRVQILSLENRLEKELLANHLLKNAKALVFAGALLEAPESD